MKLLISNRHISVETKRAEINAENTEVGGKWAQSGCHLKPQFVDIRYILANKRSKVTKFQSKHSLLDALEDLFFSKT
jgi:hypothetical protein